MFSELIFYSLDDKVIVKICVCKTCTMIETKPSRNLQETIVTVKNSSSPGSLQYTFHSQGIYEAVPQNTDLQSKVCLSQGHAFDSSLSCTVLCVFTLVNFVHHRLPGAMLSKHKAKQWQSCYVMYRKNLDSQSILCSFNCRGQTALKEVTIM